MSGFKTFISEEIDEKRLKHLEHAEDHVINFGHEGFTHAYHNLKDVHDKLTGKSNDTKVTMKYDGSPSIVFGRHPETGKFFVGSKSIFNKNPKVNYTHEDIQKNHGHAPGLVEKLKHALDHLPKVSPKKGVYQADIMHTQHERHETNGKVHFTPNTITYSTPSESKHGKAALRSKIGIAVHTKYHGKSLQDMEAEVGADVSDFHEHPDVHNISVEHDLSNSNYTDKHQDDFHKHMNAAVKIWEKTKPETHEAVGRHRDNLKTYINHTVRTGTKPSTAGFHAHYSQWHQKKVDGVKTPAAKDRKIATMNSDLSHAKENEHHTKTVLKMHHHLQKAKNTLVNAMSSSSAFEHTINGKKTKPEGFVAIRNGRPTKFVDRADFSANNFNKDKKL